MIEAWGLVEVPASDYVSQAENGEYVVHDAKTPHAGVLRMHGKGSAKGTLNYTAAFYPCLNIADPEEEEKEEEAAARKASSERGRISLDNLKSANGKDAVTAANTNGDTKVDESLAKKTRRRRGKSRKRQPKRSHYPRSDLHLKSLSNTNLVSSSSSYSTSMCHALMCMLRYGNPNIFYRRCTMGQLFSPY